MKSKLLDIKGITTHYLETEARDFLPLIILHGWGSLSEHWVEVMRYLEKEGVRAIAIDLPGFGKTQAPQGAWGLDDYEAFIRSFIETLGIKRFCLLGHSFGGRIGIKLAANDPRGLKIFIQVNSAGVTPRNKHKIFLFKLFTKIGKLIFTLPILSPFRNLFRKLIYKAAGTYDYYVQRGVMKEIFKKVIDEDLTPFLHKIIVPTYIIWGKKDKMTPVADAYIMDRNIPDSTLILFEGEGHGLNLTIPKELAEEIVKILK